MQPVAFPNALPLRVADCRGAVTEHDWQIPGLQRRCDGWFQWYLQEKINALRGR